MNLDHYDVDIRVAQDVLDEVDRINKSSQAQAYALVSIAQSLIAIAKILKEKK